MRDPWLETAAWCGTAIPRNEIVMTPLVSQDFRPYSLAATYCTWKDGAPHCFCDSTLSLWWRRMQRFGVTLPLKRDGLSALYHARAIEVARAEHIRYVVFDKRCARASGPLAFQNRNYGVIDLQGSEGCRLEKNP